MVLIKYSDGRVHPGIVLSSESGILRVAMKGACDAYTIRLLNGVWVSEDCEVVRLDFASAHDTVEAEDDDMLDNLLSAVAPTRPSHGRVM